MGRGGAPPPTAELAGLAPMLTRFAVMKHLRVLREAGIVRTMSEGRRRRPNHEPAALDPLRDWLEEAAAV